ncbi:MAG: CBS domain-containing protein [Candidatus Bathyarchaeota archaeon]|nr:MAG: CBS domain-containing protein [Candidatus Bathyarchaeota archaeon]
MSLCVQDVMVRKVLTVDSDISAKNAARMMSKFSVSSLIVSSNGEIIGILTERDILARVVASGQDPEKVTVKEVMSEPIIVVNPETPLEDAVKLMFRERIKKLPVMQREGDVVRLVGMLTITDVARIQPQLIENMRSLIQKNGTDFEVEVDFYIR